MAANKLSLGNLCAPCVSEGKTQPADVYCATCEQYQCTECSDVHSVYQFMSGHDIQSLQNSKQASETNVSLKTTDNVDELILCHLHGKALDVYCCRHSEMCCSVCIVEDHRQCSGKRGLEEYAKQTDIDSGVFHKKVLSLRDKLHKTTENIKRCGTALDGKMENLHKHLNATNSRIDEKVVLYGKRIVANIQDTKNKEFTTEPVVKGVPVATILIRCQGTFLRYKPISQRGTMSESFKAYVHFHNDVISNSSALKEAKAYVTDVSVAIDNQLQACFCDNNAFVVTFKTGLPCNGDSIGHNAEVTKPFVMKHIKHVDLTQIINAKETVFLNGVAFLPDDRIAAVDNYNKSVMLLTTSLDVLVNVPLQYNPLDIAVLSSSGIVVAGIDLKLFSINQTNKIKQVKTVFHNFSLYDSVCVFNEDTVIAGNVWRKATAVKVNVRTSVVSFFSKNAPQKKYKIGENTATVEYISAKKVLVVAHKLKDKIDFWPIDGNASITTVSHPNIKKPRGMCVGPMDCVFVCCYDSHKVVQITHDAQIVCFYSMTDLPYPVAVSISKYHSKMVVTSNCKWRTIGIFTLKALG